MLLLRGFIISIAPREKIFCTTEDLLYWDLKLPLKRCSRELYNNACYLGLNVLSWIYLSWKFFVIFWTTYNCPRHSFLTHPTLTTPYLFILSEELISRMIWTKYSKGIKPFTSSGGKLITHLFYADDLLLFADGGICSIRKIVVMLHSYQSIFGQLVSNAKSSIFFSKNFPLSRNMAIIRETGFLEGKWPCIYIGVPLHVGRLTTRLFNSLILKLQKKLVGWKSNILSFGGKITLSKHVLSSMPIHILSVLNIPKGVYKGIISIFL